MFLVPIGAQIPNTSYVNSYVFISSGDIENEDMSVITDWTDGDTGTGASTQVTFDSKSCMKLLTGAAGANYAIRTKDVGTFDTRTLISFSAYCEDIGTLANNDCLSFRACNGTTRLYLMFATDGLFVWDGAAYVEIGTHLVVADSWQEWLFDINWVAQTTDVYLNQVLVASNVDCSYASAVDSGTVEFAVVGTTTASRLAYIDWLKIGTTLLCTSQLSAVLGVLETPDESNVTAGNTVGGGTGFITLGNSLGQYELRSSIYYIGTKTISGYAKLDGVGVSGAIIRLFNQTLGQYEQTAISDVNGLFTFLGLDANYKYHCFIEYTAGEQKYNNKSIWEIVPV